jgi:hypothetical protein
MVFSGKSMVPGKVMVSTEKLWSAEKLWLRKIQPSRQKSGADRGYLLPKKLWF